ncbi:MAG: helix-turn-helix domain-containing protein [Acidimicrobiales bacterium]
MGDVAAAPASLRERKKARTRAALIDVSQRLFAEKGYADTTLDEICAEVEVTPQTLLRYFDSKAHLALAPMTDGVEQLRAFLEHPDRVLKTLVVWKEYLALEVRELEEPSSEANARHLQNLRAYRDWTEKDPVLVAMVADVDRRLREMLARSLARDWDVDDDDLHVALVAAALVAGRTAAWTRWLARDEGADALRDELSSTVAYITKRMPRSSADQLRKD